MQQYTNHVMNVHQACHAVVYCVNGNKTSWEHPEWSSRGHRIIDFQTFWPNLCDISAACPFKWYTPNCEPNHKETQKEYPTYLTPTYFSKYEIFIIFNVFISFIFKEVTHLKQ